jgi:hypothetical protein
MSPTFSDVAVEVCSKVRDHLTVTRSIQVSSKFNAFVRNRKQFQRPLQRQFSPDYPRELNWFDFKKLEKTRVDNKFASRKEGAFSLTCLHLLVSSRMTTSPSTSDNIARIVTWTLQLCHEIINILKVHMRLSTTPCHVRVFYNIRNSHTSPLAILGFVFPHTWLPPRLC